MKSPSEVFGEIEDVTGSAAITAAVFGMNGEEVMAIRARVTALLAELCEDAPLPDAIHRGKGGKTP